LNVSELSIADVLLGKLEPEKVLSLIKDNTCLVTIMHANNETGIIMPIDKIGKELKILNRIRSDQGLPHIFFHADAAQSVGKIPVSIEELGVDYLTIVGHKVTREEISTCPGNHTLSHCFFLVLRTQNWSPLCQGYWEIYPSRTNRPRWWTGKRVPTRDRKCGDDRRTWGRSYVGCRSH